MTRLARRGLRRLGLEAERLRLRLRGRVGSPPRPLDPAGAVERLSPDGDRPPTVLFLCHGNVCRSPLAERYARANAGVAARFDSAGFIEAEGRPSPDAAVRAARDHGVDLATHRSRRVTAGTLDRSDLVVVMDVRNYRRLRREFPGRRAWFLRPFAGDGVAIEDPHGEGAATFATVYGQVVAAVDGLLAALEERGPVADPESDGSLPLGRR